MSQSCPEKNCRSDEDQSGAGVIRYFRGKDREATRTSPRPTPPASIVPAADRYLAFAKTAPHQFFVQESCVELRG